MRVLPPLPRTSCAAGRGGRSRRALGFSLLTLALSCLAPASCPAIPARPAAPPPSEGRAPPPPGGAPEDRSTVERVHALARLQITGGDPEGALVALDACARAHPGVPDTEVLRGEALFAMERYAEAVEAFERGLEGRPGQRPRAFNLGRALLELGRLDEAAALFLAMSQLPSPRLSSKGYLGSGLTLQRRGDESGAEAAFRKACEVDPDNHRAHYQVGLRDLRAGRLDEAIRHFTRVLSLRPLHHGAAYNLALAEARRGNRAAARAARERWQRILHGKERLAGLRAQLRLEPRNLALVDGIADCYRELEQWEDAYRWSRRALDLRPGDPSRILRVGEILIPLGRPDLAEGVLRSLLDRPEPYSPAVPALTRLLRSLGRSAEARELERRFAPATSQPGGSDRTPEKSAARDARQRGGAER